MNWSYSSVINKPKLPSFFKFPLWIPITKELDEFIIGLPEEPKSVRHEWIISLFKEISLILPTEIFAISLFS